MVPRNKVGAPDSGGDSDRLVGLGHLDQSDWSNGGGFILCSGTEERVCEECKSGLSTKGDHSRLILL